MVELTIIGNWREQKHLITEDYFLMWTALMWAVGVATGYLVFASVGKPF